MKHRVSVIGLFLKLYKETWQFSDAAEIRYLKAVGLRVGLSYN